ncbi:MAG: DNA polymerase I [bacterium]|nr:DNA polymerase I [bacterium]
MGNKKTLILIDGHALAFRQYFALERTGMKNGNNEPTWAVYGFFKAIFDLLTKIKPDFIAVAFDVGRQTFRVERYEEYKANRETMPDALRCQIGTIVEGLQAFDIPIYTKEGFEADDVIGTISRIASESGNNTLILTGDQDSFQLIDKEGSVKVLIPSKGELIEYDWDKVYEKLGVYPNQVIDYKGLRGDTSDNIPGIRGIGEKTAQKLLGRYPHLEDLLEDCENIPEKAIKEKICTQKDIAILSKELATIIRNVDVNFDIKKASVTLPQIDKVSEFLRRMQFYTFIKNIDKILASFNADKTPQIENLSLFAQNTKQEENIQQNLFTQAIKESVEDSETEYIVVDKNSLNNALDDIKNSDIIAFSLLQKDDNQITTAISTSSNNYCFSAEYLKNLEQVFSSERIKKVGYDTKTDYHILKKFGITLKGLAYDVLLASYVKDPARKNTIEAQSLDCLNHISADMVNTELYLCDKSATILKLHDFWIKNLDEKETKIVQDIELPLTTVLAKMEENGVAINTEYLKELSDYMTEKLAELEDLIFQLAGGSFNINSPKQVAEVLFDKLELKTKKKKKARSTSAEVLEELAEEYEICDYILQHRKFSKLKSTYTDSLPTLISKADRRIHTTYNQALTVTGRLSSSNPNLQNIPIRTEEGNKIRAAFCADDKDNYQILSADYSQIELRLLAHVSGDKNLTEAFVSGEDVHTITASKVFGVKLEDVTKDMRRKAKAVNFGIVYGQSRYGLAKNLGISNEEAQEFIDKYFEHYPKVKEYMKNKIDFVNQYGYVETIFGRKRYLASELASGNYQIREFAQRAAINQPLQGTAADLIKMAMIDIQNKIEEQGLKTKMIMQVHDELVFEVPNSELDKIKELVKKSMELNQPLNVPLELDINCGDSWQEN